MTVKDLARLAGVDHSTVSRALNDSPRVREETKKKIRDLAREHNFQFNSNARSLSSRRTGVVGIIYPAGMDDFNSSLYTNRLFMDIRKELETYQLDGILLEAKHPVTGGSNVERLIRQNKVDGFLIFHASISGDDYRLIRKWELPVVQVHLRPYDYPVEQLDFFSTDNFEGGRLAAEHLAGCGCKRFFDFPIPFCKDREVLPPSYEQSFDECLARSNGFSAGLEAAGIEGRFISRLSSDGSFQNARETVLDDLLSLKAGDGLFFHSDLQAIGALTACRERGIRVPEDIKIVGFDDSPMSVLMDQGITTIHQPREIIACRSAMRINRLIEEKFNQTESKDEEQRLQEQIAPELIIRETTQLKGVL